MSRWPIQSPTDTTPSMAHGTAGVRRVRGAGRRRVGDRAAVLSAAAVLDGLALCGEAWCTAPQLRGTVADSLNACAEQGVEGIVPKRIDSPYRPGQRSGDWLKVKTADWRVAHAPRRRRR